VAGNARHPVYTTVARGFQFGGVIRRRLPTTSLSAVVQASTIWSYELGTRTDWFAKTLQFDLTASGSTGRMQLRQTCQRQHRLHRQRRQGGSIGLESSLRWLTPIPGVMLTTTLVHSRRGAEGVHQPDSVDIPRPGLAGVAATADVDGAGYTLYFAHSPAAQRHLFVHRQGWNNVVHEGRIFDYGVLDAGSLHRDQCRWRRRSASTSPTSSTRAFVGSRQSRKQRDARRTRQLQQARAITARSPCVSRARQP